MTDIQSIASELTPTELHAVAFLCHGPDVLGEIDSEPKMAAALCYSELQRRGIVQFAKADAGARIALTDLGVEVALLVNPTADLSSIIEASNG